MQIYELHLRDFSASDESVPLAHRGKYLAFADRESNGMRHLRALAAAGITDVHLLPVFDIATIPETGCLSPKPEGAADSESQASLIAATHDRDCYNWGYEPLHYTAPEGSYASDPGDGRVRVREFRRMVQGLHAAGLRVGMDVVYNHTSASGQEAKSVLDRNSYDSGDWFNAIDWRFRDNGFGRGLPSKADNGKDWPLLRPLLANAALKPDAAAIRWTRDAFLDLLRIRASSSLFRLRNAEQVMGRLQFLNTGPDQVATLLVEHLDGQHLAGAGFAELMVFVNVDTQATEFNAERAGNKHWQLHPIQRNAHAADTRVRNEARYDSDHQRFHIPARSAVVFVIDANGENE
jgi:pullulanase/glycogen debranching enzyme